MRSLVKLLRLPTAEMRLLFAAAAILAVVRIGIALLPFPRLSGFFRWLGSRTSSARSPRTPAAVARATERASRVIPRASCLCQSFAVAILLRRMGYRPTVCIGVAGLTGSPLQGHAWVECGGSVIIGESEMEGFTPALAIDWS
jgi:hypothetical protein